MKPKRSTTIGNVRILALASVGLALAFLLGACNTAPVVTSVTIQGGNTSIFVGATKTLKATVLPSSAPQTVTWSTSDATVLTVTTAGVIKGIKAGTAKITAKSTVDPSKSATITVTVSVATSPAVTSVTIDQGNQTLTVGGTASLTATVSAVGGASSDVTWSSSDPNIATVASTGPTAATLTAKAKGTATITATSVFDATKSGSITVTVNLPAADPTNIYVDASAAAGGNGSSAFPYQTINDGIAAVNAGGTVHVAAGTYPETLYITKALTLSGAGPSSTIITASGDATGPFSAASIVGVNVDGLTLEGFTLRLTTPGPTTAGIDVFNTSGNPVSANITIQNVNVDQQDTGNNSTGVYLIDVAGSTVTNVTVTSSYTSAGAGIWFRGGSNIAVSNVTTSGHESYAGLLLFPDGTTMSNVAIQGTFNEVNKMEIRYDNGGTVTGLTAPQFVDVVRNTANASGNYWFYKESEATAILDSLFNFGANYSTSFVQPLDPTDQAVLQPAFVVGSANGASYGYGAENRALSLQTAINNASSGDTIYLRTGPITAFTGPFNVTVPNLTISGAGSTTGGNLTTLTSSTAPVVTVSANGVSIGGSGTGVGITTADASAGSVTVASGVTGFSVTYSNLTSAFALDNSAGGGSATATNNWWGQAGGPVAGQVTGTADTTSPASSAY